MSLIRPGMPVRVTNPNDLYYGYEGQVQRMVDQSVGVIFTGGNWIKLVTFKLSDITLVDKTQTG